MTVDPHTIATTWLSSLQALCTPADDPETFASNLGAVFAPDAWLRDLLALSWDFHTLQGPDAIKEYLTKDDRLRKVGLSNIRLDASTTGGGATLQAQPDGTDCIVLLFCFDITAPAATGRGCARLLAQSDGSWKAWTTLLVLHDIVGHEEKLGRQPPIVGKTWDEAWEELNATVEEDLGVLVVGGGHTGLMVAARLKYFGIKYLVIERGERVGGSWSSRYPTLKLHTPTHMNTLPYQPFPPTWPKYLPKTKVASFLRSYQEAQDLLVWESTEMLTDPAPQYDEESKKWTVQVTRSGNIVTLHPRHIVLATGMNGAPRPLVVPGLDEFEGIIYHGDAHKDASRWKGKSVVVIGTGNSGGDIALDLVERGAGEITLVQRGPTTVWSMPTADAFIHQPNFPESLPIDECDLIANTTPHRLLLDMLRGGLEAVANGMDREMLDGLKQAGFLLSDIPLYELLLERSGGFIMDHGTAPHIISGRIKMKAGVEVERLEKDAIVFSDGTQLPAEVIITATGYTGMRETARKIFGSAVVDKTSPVLGLDEEGEVRGSFRPLGQEGLYYAAGTFPDSRFFGRLLALQILARDLGLVNTRP
ncbi:FAD/NAD(P)-binding domain-containing protein [Exidia glandulosa HHB12029]|uniref:FAD/NAD(P)-binding domain-containing protein n=1 Tax=Exidia glandulosa HHB12029 TaxID=1314781 RepID=A0A165JKZ9_EXIGL|nr:FAD/NAD(P)-binding domain-containing protein [Exidia glandulosa HHB12029]